jgi:hypothetical protein
VSVQERISELKAAGASEAHVSLTSLIPLLEARGRAVIKAGDIIEGIKILERLARIANGSSAAVGGE